MILFNPYSYYRLSNYLYQKGIPVIPKAITYLLRLVFSCYIPASANIGKGLILGYGGLSVVLHDRCVIGKHCHIDQSVTIGGTSKKVDVPVLGDFVYVGAGAKILGPVKIGNNVVIGANAVVIQDIPDNSLAVGVPARVIRNSILKSEYV